MKKYKRYSGPYGHFEKYYEYDDLYRLMESELVELYRAKRYVVEKLERPSNFKDGGEYRETFLEVENSEKLIEAYYSIINEDEEAKDLILKIARNMDGKEVDPYEVFKNDKYVRVDDGRDYDLLEIILYVEYRGKEWAEDSFWTFFTLKKLTTKNLEYVKRFVSKYLIKVGSDYPSEVVLKY